MPKFVRAILTPFRLLGKPLRFLAKPLRKLPKVERGTLLAKSTKWSRTLSFVCLAICPLLLIYQLAVWTEVRFWSDVSVGSLIFPDPETARQFNHGSMRFFLDMLWIPLWFEFLSAAVVLFATHMILWNRMDAKRQERRRARRTTNGYGANSARRRRSR